MLKTLSIKLAEPIKGIIGIGDSSKKEYENKSKLVGKYQFSDNQIDDEVDNKVDGRVEKN